MIEVAPLIGIKWAEADCRQLALRVLDALGIQVPARQAWEGASFSEAGFVEYMTLGGDGWGLVAKGDGVGAVPATYSPEEGDVIVSFALDESGRKMPHLSVVVDEQDRLAITTTKAMGSMIWRIRQIQSVRSIWRRK